jgi:hypothetical protein
MFLAAKWPDRRNISPNNDAMLESDGSLCRTERPLCSNSGEAACVPSVGGVSQSDQLMADFSGKRRVLDTISMHAL